MLSPDIRGKLLQFGRKRSVNTFVMLVQVAKVHYKLTIWICSSSLDQSSQEEKDGVVEQTSIRSHHHVGK
jgi:hypothetical protein